MSPRSNRNRALAAFVAAQVGPDAPLAPASADASFRTYWRTHDQHSSLIVMDSPPDLEPVEPWLDVAARLHAVGLHAPQVLASDCAQGFLLLEDLGLRTYLPELNPQSAEELYAPALDALFVMQTRVRADGLPLYDATRLLAEMEYLPEWLLQRHLGHTLDATDRATLATAFGRIVAIVAEQPQCFVHRDYHSRNLLVTAQNSPGIIDFQGAMLGPLTYDLVSLLRDCYIAWPQARIDSWVERYRERLISHGLTDADSRCFRRWFDFTGLQRHIKVLGLFCRLCHRDGKTQYLDDLPLVLRYTLDVAAAYPELAEFSALLTRLAGQRDLRRVDTHRVDADA